jgi:hypothetical protein
MMSPAIAPYYFAVRIFGVRQVDGSSAGFIEPEAMLKCRNSPVRHFSHRQRPCAVLAQSREIAVAAAAILTPDITPHTNNLRLPRSGLRWERSSGNDLDMKSKTPEVSPGRSVSFGVGIRSPT